ncbi:MAG: hypothetical protein HQL94_00360 [Magnetococcales bacterium]|nr:hypothetical protein [Magnetococcales bacterium]MBF0439562.1 hypothetical protein [Magnetococcales bacterium]
MTDTSSEVIAPHPPSGVVRVALAGHHGAGHWASPFASCTHFMIYDVTQDSVNPVTKRPVSGGDRVSDKVVGRLALIRDSRILVISAIGGPAAAQVTRAGILPVKVDTEISSVDWLENLRQVLEKKPPPWLQMAL